MYKNDAGLTILENGDEVRIGKGKVLYTFRGYYAFNEAEAIIQSHNTFKNTQAEVARLVLVTNVRDTDDWKAQNEAPAEEPVKETSAYAKAILFALNRLQKHVYAGTVRKNVKAKRRSLGRRQKASRKANR